MISLTQYIVNEVSKETLLGAAKKAKEIGDPRADKFYKAFLDAAQKEFDSIDVDKQKAIKSKSKKIMSKLSKISGYTLYNGFGDTSHNRLINKDGGVVTIFTEAGGVLPTKSCVKIDHKNMKKSLDKIDDDDLVIMMMFNYLESDKTGYSMYVMYLPSINETVIFDYIEVNAGEKSSKKYNKVSDIENDKMKSLVEDFTKPELWGGVKDIEL